jgi:hypothetical protein
LTDHIIALILEKKPAAGFFVEGFGMLNLSRIYLIMMVKIINNKIKDSLILH